VRILYLTPGCFDKGGISRYSRYQVKVWREILGQDSVKVLSLLGPKPDGFEEPFEVDWSGGECTRKTKARFVARSLECAVRYRPDIVHSAHVNIGGLAHGMAKSIGARSLLNVYGLEVWSGMRRDARLGLKLSDMVISDCEWTARWIEEHNLRPAGRATVIWDCVDTFRFSPGRCPAEILARYRIPDPETGINLLTLGRLSPDAAHKGYERLLEVFFRTAPSHPSLRLIFAGAGALAGVLAARAQSHGFADRVFFTGTIHERDLPDVYRSAHIFSLVSDRGPGRGEGLPLTPLEAAGCGVPILVGNQDGSQEAVVEGEGGWVLDPFDLERHSNLIARLTENGGLRRSMGQRARLRCETEFAYSEFKAKHERMLRISRQI